MNTPDRSDEFAASGRSLVTDVQAEKDTVVQDLDWDHRNDKIDRALTFGGWLAALAGGQPDVTVGRPAVSLGLFTAGQMTVAITLHDDEEGDSTYIVKAVRVEDYPQDF